MEHPNAAGMSDAAIAEHCGVGHAMVSEYRKRLSTVESQPANRTGRDGRTINTANSGSISAAAFLGVFLGSIFFLPLLSLRGFFPPRVHRPEGQAGSAPPAF